MTSLRKLCKQALRQRNQEQLLRQQAERRARHLQSDCEALGAFPRTPAVASLCCFLMCCTHPGFKRWAAVFPLQSRSVVYLTFGSDTLLWYLESSSVMDTSRKAFSHAFCCWD